MADINIGVSSIDPSKVTVHDLSCRFYSRIHDAESECGLVLADLIKLLTKFNVEDTARFIASWPGLHLVDDIHSILRTRLKETEDASGRYTAAGVRDARYCVQILGLIFRVGVTPHQLQQLFDMMHPSSRASVPNIHGAALWALETAAKCRALRRSGAAAFWSFPGWLHNSSSIAVTSHHTSAATTPRKLAKRPPEGFFSPSVPASSAVSQMSGYLSLSWPRWPFARGFSLWTSARVRSFGSGVGEDRTSILRILGGNGVGMQLWLERGAVHYSLNVPPSGADTASPRTPLPSGGRASMVHSANELFGGLLNTISGGQTGGDAESSANSPFGLHEVSAPSAALTEGRWVSICISHVVRRNLLSQKSCELVIYIDSVEVLRKTDIAYPSGLAAAPLIICRVGETVEGELGPLYFWNEETPCPSQQMQGELARYHDGDVVHILPPMEAAKDPDHPINKPYALFHPANHSASYSLGECLARAPITTEFITCECPDTAGSSGSQVVGYNGVACVAGLSIRDAIHGIGGLKALLPLFGTGLSAALRQSQGQSGLVRQADLACADADLALVVETGESRSVSSQMLDIISFFLRDHVPNCQQALRVSLMSIIRLEMVEQLKLPRPESVEYLQGTEPSSALAHMSEFRRQATYDALPTDHIDGGRAAAHSDGKLVPALFALAHACAILPALKVETWKTLLCWLPTYALSASHVQLQLLHQLRQAARANPDFFRHEVQLNHLLLGMHAWYGLLCTSVQAFQAITAHDLIVGRKDVDENSDLTACLHPTVRKELLREYLRFLGACLGAANVVSRPAEIAPSVTAGSVSKRGALSRPSAATLADSTNKRDAKDLKLLAAMLCADMPVGIPGCVEQDALESPVEQYQAEILAFVSALMDFDSSHASYDVSEMLSQAALDFGSKASLEIAAKGGGAFMAEEAESRVLDAVGLLVASGTTDCLKALDAAVDGDFISTLIFRTLLRAKSSQLFASTLRAIFTSLRANGAKSGRWRVNYPWRHVRVGYKTVLEKERLVGIMKHIASTAVGSSFPAHVTPGGSIWSNEFQRSRGYELLFGIIRDFPKLDQTVYESIFESCFIPDSVDFTVSVDSDMSMPDRLAAARLGQSPDLWSPEARSINLRAAVNHNVPHPIFGSREWFKDPANAACKRTDDAIICNPESLKLILRLLPRFPKAVAHSALKDIDKILRGSELNRRILFTCLKGWEVYLFLFALGIRPDADAYPPLTAGRVDGATRTASSFELVTDLLCFLLRQSVNHSDGWKAFRHLLAMQPLFMETPVRNSRNPQRVEWSLRTGRSWSEGASKGSLAFHGQYLLTTLLNHIFDDFDAKRTRNITKAHFENMICLTVLCDRLVATSSSSDMDASENSAAVTELKIRPPPARAEASDRRNRSNSFSGGMYMDETEDEDNTPHWTPTRDRDGAISSFASKMPEPTADVLASPASATPSAEMSKIAAQSVDSPCVEILASTAADEPAPVRFDHEIAIRLLAMWDRLLPPVQEKSEKFLLMTAENDFPSAGSLRHQLISLSSWVLVQFPMWSPEFRKAAIRLERCMTPLFREVVPKAKGLQLIDSTLPSSDPTDAGRASSRSRSRSSSTSSRRGSSASAQDEDWEDIGLYGRPAITSEQWVLFLIDSAYRVAHRLVNVEGASITLEGDRMNAGLEGFKAVIDVLHNILSNCHHAADIAHINLMRFQTFIDAAKTCSSWSAIMEEVRLSESRDSKFAWLQQSTFGRPVQTAVDMVHRKEAEMVYQIDDKQDSFWTKQMLTVLRENIACLQPLLREKISIAAERSVRSQASASKAQVGSSPYTDRAGGGFAQKGAKVFKAVSEFVGGLNGPTVMTPELEGDEVIQLASDGEVAERGPEDFGPAMDMTEWAPSSVRAAVGPYKVNVPEWYKSIWKSAHTECKQRSSELIERFQAIYVHTLTQRRDLLGCVQKAYVTSVKILSLENGPWSGDFTFRAATEKLSMKEDYLRRRLRLVPLLKPRDYTQAAYAMYKETAAGGKIHQDSAAVHLGEDNQVDAKLLAVAKLVAAHAPRRDSLTDEAEEEDAAALVVTDAMEDAQSTGASSHATDDTSSVASSPTVSRTRDAPAQIQLPSVPIVDVPRSIALHSKEQARIHREACKLVTQEVVFEGLFTLTTMHIIFEPLIANEPESRPFRSEKQPEPKRWSLSLLTRIFARRYLLQHNALEFSFIDGSTCFIVFKTPMIKEVFKEVWQSRPPRLSSQYKALRPQKLLEKSRLTDRWQRREISNFEYIMELNTMAGRTFNDLTQYPVFPWVISNYSSSFLDLSDPSNFRDLSKPIGALNPTRLEQFRARMEGLEGSDIPPFLYGSHYSNAGFVIFYLLRLEPFTRMHVELQSGHFDCPDRLFFSVAECWKGVTHSMTDVKELIPEWYTTPEMFQNKLRLPLGELQDKAGVVDDVVLPPWAKDAHEFVWMNRAALESEYVSQHLHEWVDLIFGYKQRGEAARNADNLFYYLTYEGAVDLAEIEDAVMKQATEAQILNFGQTPSQLFTKPHPKRAPLESLSQPLFGFDTTLTASRTRSSGRAKFALSRRISDAALLGSGDAGAPTSASELAKPSQIAPLGFAHNGIAVYTALVHPNNSGQTAAMLANARVYGAQAANKGSDIAQLVAKPAVFNRRQCATARSQSLAYCTSFAGRLITCYGDYSVSAHRWTPYQSFEGLPFDIRSEKPRALFHADLSTSRQVVGSTATLPRPTELVLNAYHDSGVAACASIHRMLPAVVAASSCFALVVPSDMESARTGGYPDAFIFSCGYVDGGIRWQGITKPGNADSWLPRQYRMADVCCMAVADDKCTLVTGHTDGTAHIWMVAVDSRQDWVNVVEKASTIFDPHAVAHLQATVSPAAVPAISGMNSKLLVIHLGTLPSIRTPVTCVTVNKPLGLVAVGGLDGVCVLSSLTTAKTLRIFRPHDVIHDEDMLPVSVSHLVISAAGFVCVHWVRDMGVGTSAVGSILANCHINGAHYAVQNILRPSDLNRASPAWVTSLSASRDGTAYVVGCSDGVVEVRHGLSLEVGSCDQTHTDCGDIAVNTSVATSVADFIGDTSARSPLAQPTAGPRNPLGSITAGLSAARSTIGGAFSRLGKGAERRVDSAGAVGAAVGDVSNASPAISATSAAPSQLVPMPLVPPGTDARRAVYAPAITFISFTDDDRLLLAGTADGRLVVITDPAVAQRTLANSLQQGLFSLV